MLIFKTACLCDASKTTNAIAERSMDDACPLWFNFDLEYQDCRCLEYYAARCFHHKTYLFAGYCATYDEDTEVLSLSFCPYHGFNFTKVDVVWYLQLPDNLTALNDYMCGPLNRRGRVCTECKEGYGHAVTSVGFQYFECAKCSGNWHGISLYLFLELFPITAFYIVILIFQVKITSAPMTCFILYSQLVVVANDHIFGGDDPMFDDVSLLLSQHSTTKFLFNAVYAFYDIWNLRFFRYLIPSFCISETLKPIQLAFLDYVSVLYPLFLIALTWVFVELHGRNYRPIVLLWMPFHTCFVRIKRRWDTASDLINVFASFFLLSFTKVLYQALLLLTVRRIKTLQYDGASCGFYYIEFANVIAVDQSVSYGSTTHLLYLTPGMLITFIFVVLPSFLLTFYPFRVFRAVLSVCRVNKPSINFFVEKFYGCYRDGLDGENARDMRSFAGLYLFVRYMMFLSNVIAGVLHIANNDPYFLRGILLIITALLIGLCRPYKETYMNVLDTLLLAHLALMCHLMSSEASFSVRESLAYTFLAMLALPMVCFFLYLVVWSLKKVLKTRVLKSILEKCSLCSRKLTFQAHRLSAWLNTCQCCKSSPNEQLLLDTSAIEVNYGTF